MEACCQMLTSCQWQVDGNTWDLLTPPPRSPPGCWWKFSRAAVFLRGGYSVLFFESFPPTLKSANGGSHKFRVTLTRTGNNP